MQLELKALHEALGLTFVYVTHNQSEALTMSDRVAGARLLTQSIPARISLMPPPARRSSRRWSAIPN